MAGLLANAHLTLYESQDPTTIYVYTPGLCRLASGRLVATMDQGGPGVKDLDGPKGVSGRGQERVAGHCVDVRRSRSDVD